LSKVETLGCLKHTYSLENTSPLRVIRDYENPLKCVQSCVSVDPLSKKYPELSPYQFASNNPIQFVDIDGLEAGDPPNNDGNTKVEKSTAEKVLGIVTKGVEHLFDNVTFTLTSVPAAVGNTAKSFIKQSNRLGFLKALDIGSGAVLSDKEKFTPYGFSFDSKTKFTQKGNEQHEGTENVVDYDTGKKLIGGTVTLATSGLGTGVKGFIGKIILGKGLDALGKKDTPNNTKSEGGPPTLHKSIDIHVTAEPVLQAPSSGDVPQK
jgi:hypothetical protein